MFNLIRRVSSSFLPRQDRPWRDDATSTAPTIGLKRRLSSTEQDGDEQATVKKSRGPAEEAALSRDESPAVALRETEEVKEVTKGVEGVELENVDGASGSSGAAPNEQTSLPSSGELATVEEEESAEGEESSEPTKAEHQSTMVEKDPTAVPLPDEEGERLVNEESNEDGTENADEYEERSSSPDHGNSTPEQVTKAVATEESSDDEVTEVPNPDIKRVTRSVTKNPVAEDSHSSK